MVGEATRLERIPSVLTITRSAASRPALAAPAVLATGIDVSRYALIVILALIGLSKFTAGEAAGIAPLVAHSPLLAWTAVFGSQQTTSDVIGASELLIVVLLLLRPIFPRAAALGALLAIGTFLITLSFLITTPHAFAFQGLAVLGDVGAFLIKDLGLLGASIVVLGDALAASQKRNGRG
jgi:reactive chlorine resistance protein C